MSALCGLKYYLTIDKKIRSNTISSFDFMGMNNNYGKIGQSWF